MTTVGFTDAITSVVADLMNFPAGAGVTSNIAARFLSQHKNPPCLVWMPQTEVPGPLRGNQNMKPRQLLTRRVRFLVHIWGSDPSQVGDLRPTEALLSALEAALYRVCHGYVTIGAADWSGETGTGAQNTFGATVILEVFFDIPVTDLALGSATATQENATIAPFLHTP